MKAAKISGELKQITQEIPVRIPLEPLECNEAESPSHLEAYNYKEF